MQYDKKMHNYKIVTLSVLLIITFSIQITSTQLVLNCLSKIEEFSLINSQNSCNVQNILNIYEPNTEIQDVDGQADSYTALLIIDKRTEFLPSNLGKKFINLIALKVLEGRLKEVRQNELKSLTNLQYINFDQNDIEFLDNNVFDFNLKLKVIWLGGNKISYIGNSIFDNLIQLNNVDFRNNTCVSTSQMNLKKFNFAALNLIKENCSNVQAEANYLFCKSLFVNTENLNLLQKLEDLKAKSAEIDRNLNASQQEYKKYKKDVDSNELQRSTDLKTLAKNENQLKQNISILKIQINLLNRRNDNLTGPTTSLRKNYTDYENQFTKLNANSSKVAAKYLETREEHIKYAQNVDNIKQQLSSATKENENLKTKLERLNSSQNESSNDDSNWWTKLILLTSTALIVAISTTIDVFISFKN
ncbi:unnamed protein product [Chironomus riparius]|uniref:Uncharacterized protein n=1 Tax=Chironomus riparius TaxID=315576 RepID=A0A9N9WZR9_9DIPT|nr:unnamed protein product [Chironomus riparius]